MSKEAMKQLDALISKYSDKLHDSVGPHDAAKFEEDCNHIRQTLAEQPAPAPGYCTHCKKYSIAEPLPAPVQQEPVGDALYFAQWTADKKDLSDYVLVGSLSLAGIEDGEYGQSEIDSFENAIEALQEKLVTGADHKKVPLLAYIGALNSTSPQPAQQEPVVRWDSDGWGDLLVDSLPDGTLLYTSPPAQRTWVGLTDADKCTVELVEAEVDPDWIDGYKSGLKDAEAKLKEKNI